MPSILALDTSTEACSVALLHGGELLEDFRVLPKEHTRFLLPMVDALLSRASIGLTQLDAIAFGRGPGSFTGLRVCAGVVQGLALGADIPVIPLSTLQVLAQTAVVRHKLDGDQAVLAALDARMDEVYWCTYSLDDAGLVWPVGEEVLSAPERVALPLGDKLSEQEHSKQKQAEQRGIQQATRWFGAGSGWRYAPRIATQPAAMDTELLPSASAMLSLAKLEWHNNRLLDPQLAVPRYLRDEVAWR